MTLKKMFVRCFERWRSDDWSLTLLKVLKLNFKGSQAKKVGNHWRQAWAEFQLISVFKWCHFNMPLFESSVGQKWGWSWYFKMMGDTVMMFLFAYRQLLGWVTRCFRHWYTYKHIHTKHCYEHTERTTLKTQRYMHNTYKYNAVAHSDTHLMD